MAEDRKKGSPEQLSVMVEEIEKDHSLAALKGRGRHDKLLYLEKWEILAKKLNSIENGAKKSINKWQQTWRDLRSNTKKKANKSGVELTDLEQRVLKMDTEMPAFKQEGIDTSMIAEIDPLSSEEDNTGQDRDPMPEVTGDMVTVYSSMEKSDNGKRSQSSSENGNVKRQRLHLLPDANLSQQTADALTRIASIEEARKESEDKNMKLLEDILANLVQINSKLEIQIEMFYKKFVAESNKGSEE